MVAWSGGFLHAAPSDWLTLLQRIVRYHQEKAIPEVVGGTGLQVATLNYAGRKLFYEGRSPITEPTPTPLFRPLRPRDSLLEDTLRYNFGLILPERFPLRPGSQDFPTEGEFWVNPGEEEQPPPTAYQALFYNARGNPKRVVSNLLSSVEDINPISLAVPPEDMETGESPAETPSTSAGTTRRIVQQTDVWDQEDFLGDEDEGLYEVDHSVEDPTEFYS